MYNLLLPIITGIILAIIYTSLLIGPTIRRLWFLKPYTIAWLMSGMLIRLGIIAAAVYAMLHYSLNHLILMMIAFYAAVLAIMIAYKGVR